MYCVVSFHSHVSLSGLDEIPLMSMGPNDIEMTTEDDDFETYSTIPINRRSFSSRISSAMSNLCYR